MWNGSLRNPLASLPFATEARKTSLRVVCLRRLRLSSFAFLLFAACISSCLSAAPPEAFRANVRPTDPIPAGEQQKQFRLPDGFHIELVAAEPQIYKPMNMAFDASGRLWVSESQDYPFPAPDGKGNDRIQVLEDTDGDGRMDKTTTFVDGLNIPIGLLPYGDGVIAYSIPNIYYFRDTDADGQCDKREVLYGPLGVPRDTHGMQNAFRRGFDGWIYVCHGFSNESTITGKDGSSIQLQSGNTYRIRPDGSRVEQFTWGQVNPFGSTFTPWGDLITADCHSKPLTLLLRGGYYSSFGKPHDGLGFVPSMMEHLHDSTAIAGASYYAADNFPETYRGKLFVGNVVTSRINCDRLEFRGATATALEQDDFVTCGDPWFRPVDLQVAPDGSLYVADFYNRIIGHYEVPLDHPGRDRKRGRIWRIYYGDDPPRPSEAAPLSKAGTHQLIEAVGVDNLRNSMMAIDQLVDRVGLSGADDVRAVYYADKSNDSQRAALLWVLHRLNRLDDAELAFAMNNGERLLRIHAMRVISETKQKSEATLSLALSALSDPDPIVRRNAADALGRQSDLSAIRPLLAALQATGGKDIYLARTMQIAVRNLLRLKSAYESLKTPPLSADARSEVAKISLAVNTSESAEFLLDYAIANRLPTNQAADYLTNVAANLRLERFDEFVRLVRSNRRDDVGLQHRLLLSLHEKLTARGVEPMKSIQDWATDLATDWLAKTRANRSAWRVVSGDNSWDLEQRACEDGKRVAFLSSLPGGERARSVLRSRTFKLPAKLSFYLCGHLGYPGKPADKRNYVALRLANGKEIARAVPPRSDVARRVEWELPEHVGKQVYIDVVDQNDLPAFAWLAVSRFDIPTLRLPQIGRRENSLRMNTATQVAAVFRLTELSDDLLAIATDAENDAQLRLPAARAYARLQGSELQHAIVGVAAEKRVSDAWRRRLIDAAIGSDPVEPELIEFMRAASGPLQRAAAMTLGASPAGARSLLNLIDKGAASGRLLQDQAVLRNLIARNDSQLNQRVAKLTAGLTAPSVETQKRIVAAVAAFRGKPHSTDRGRLLFEKHCHACHKVKDKGAEIGPQLDGIGNRGLLRVVEDLLDPDRNVDAAFRVSSIALEDGRIVSGLLRRKEGEVLVLADEKGKEFMVNVKQIDEQRLTLNSLMPSNFAEQLKPSELSDLLAYLISLQAKPKPKQTP